MDDGMQAAQKEFHDGVEVVRIIARMNVGGPALQVIDLSTAAPGNRSTVVVTGAVADGEMDVADRAKAAGVHVIQVAELGRRVRPWQDLVALFKLYRLLRRIRPRIVHTHTAKAGALGRLAAVLARVPVRVHTYHGHVFHGYFGPVLTGLYIRIERLLARATTAVVTISPRQAEEIVERFGICEPNRIRMIPLGFSLDRFAPDPTGQLGRRFRVEVGGADTDRIVTIVGRLAPIKNHELFLSMAARLLDSGERCRFAIVGGGEEEARLRMRADELKIADCVSFLGWRSDLEEIYAGSDMVVLTSWNEGTPVCLIEALAAGCAVVSTNVGGVADVLEDGRLGSIVPPGEAEALTDAVATLLHDPARRREFGTRGASAIRRRYSVERLRRDINRLYCELMASRADGR